MSTTQGCVGAKGGFTGSTGASMASEGSAFAAAKGLTSGTGVGAVSTSAGAGVGSRAGAGLRDVGVAAGATAARELPQCPQNRAPARTGAWQSGHNAADKATGAAAGVTTGAGNGSVANVPPQLLQCRAPARLTAAQVGQITLIQSPCWPMPGTGSRKTARRLKRCVHTGCHTARYGWARRTRRVESIDQMLLIRNKRKRGVIPVATQRRNPAPHPPRTALSCARSACF